MKPRDTHIAVRQVALFLVLAMCTALLAGCRQQAAQSNAPLLVKAQTVQLSDYMPTLTLTGDISARVQSDLSFRVTGRIVERNVDVGARVEANQALARLDPKEQQSDVDGAVAAVQAAEAKLRQVTSSFDRQKLLLAQGFTTRRDYDQAEQELHTAQATLDSARAQLGTVRDRLGHAVLHAPSSGIITARNAEAGHVVQAAQTVFTLAHDGPRDAVINVQETIIGTIADASIEIALITDPKVRTVGEVREVAPAVDAVTGTVRVKIGITHTPPEMQLGSAVTVTAHAKPRQMVVLPWSALTSDGGKPAVWVAEPRERRVSLRRVALEAFDSSNIIVRDGLRQGEVVITVGVQLLRPNQEVAFAGEKIQ